MQSNFAFDEDQNVYVLDFGLSRRYREDGGEVKQARQEAEFRGTSRYASLAAHNCQDLGRVDDLWSLFYVLLEFITGTLPWMNCKQDKARIHELKNALHSHLQSSLDDYPPEVAAGAFGRAALWKFVRWDQK